MLSLLLAAAIVFRFWRYVKLGFYADDLMYFDTFLKRGVLLDLLHPSHSGGYFRPLAYDLYLPLAFRAFGLHGLGYHLVQLGLLLAQAGLLYRLGRLLGLAREPAWIATLLYGLSCTHSVEIAWVSCTADGMANALSLGAAVAHLRGRRWVAAACFAAALLAKESSATLLLGLAALGLSRQSPRMALKSVLYLLPIVGAWAILLALHYRPGLLVAGFSPAAMLGVVPALLACAFGFQPWVLPGNPLQSAWGAVGLAAALAAAAPLAAPAPPARPRVLAACLLFSASMLLPLLPVAMHLSAYYLNLPLAGVFLVLASLAWRLPVEARGLLLAGVLLAGEGSLNLGARGQLSHGAAGLTGDHLEMTGSVVRAFERDIPAAVPVPAESTLFCFVGLPELSGVVISDTPLLRLEYRNRSLQGTYLGALDRYSMRRPVEFFRWHQEDQRLEHLPATSTTLELLALESEMAGNPRGTLALMQVETASNREPTWMHWPGGAWSAWNRGYAAWELGDTAAAERAWDGARALTEPRAAARRIASGPGASAPSADMAEFGSRLAALRWEPRDARLLLSAARSAGRFHSPYADVLVWRACCLAPGDAGIRAEGVEYFESEGNHWAAERVRDLGRR